MFKISIMNTGSLILIIFVAVLLQIVIAVSINIFRRKYQHQKINTESNKDPTINPTLNPIAEAVVWKGFREFIVQRKVFENNNHTICSFYLIPADGKPLPNFKPGQFLTIKLDIMTPDKANCNSIIRCYSISDSYRSEYYRLSIKLVPAPSENPHVPPGVSSSFFHNHVIKGSKLLVKAPSGHFHLMENVLSSIVLIAGGIGITPMLSILNTVLTHRKNQEIWLYYGLQNGDEHIMKEHLQTLAKTYNNFHLHVCYSSPNKSDIEDVDYQHKGFVSIPLLRATLKLMYYQFYVCGPKLMMETLVPGLEDWGIDSSNIYYESFGPASLIRHKKKDQDTTSVQPVTVTFNNSRKSVAWDITAQSLLEFAEANDIEVNSGCRAGSCGTCQTKIEAGEVDYNQEPDAEVLPGYCLLCISTPKNNLTLDA